MLPGRLAALLFVYDRLSHDTEPRRPSSPVPFNILGTNLDWVLSEGLAVSSSGQFGNVPLCSCNNDDAAVHWGFVCTTETAQPVVP